MTFKQQMLTLLHAKLPDIFLQSALQFGPEIGVIIAADSGYLNSIVGRI